MAVVPVNLYSPTATGALVTTAPTAAKKVALNYSLNSVTDTTPKWIYSNYPEHPVDNFFGDSDSGNHYLVREVLTAGTYQIFYTYWLDKVASTVPNSFNFGIQIYNPSSTATVTITKQNRGHSCVANDANTKTNLNKNVWTQFFASSNSTVTVPRTGVTGNPKMIESFPVSKGNVFHGVYRFSVDNPCTVFLYFYKNESKLAGNASISPNMTDIAPVSGYGRGFMYTGNISLTTKGFTGSANNRYFNMCYPSDGIEDPNPFSAGLVINNASASSDLISIKTERGTVAVNNAGNLGNWGLQYLYNVSLKNDDTVGRRISAYVVPYVTSSNNYPVIQSGSNVYTSILGVTNKAWKIWDVYLPAQNDTASISYQFINGTEGCGKWKQIFTVV